MNEYTVHTHTHLYKHVYMYVFTYTYMYIYIYVHVYASPINEGGSSFGNRQSKYGFRIKACLWGVLIIIFLASRQ